MKFWNSLNKNNKKNIKNQPVEITERSNADSNSWWSPDYSISRFKEPDKALMENNRCMCAFPDSPIVDYYKVLRTRIEQRVRKNNWNTIMITSVGPGEGKTLTAINLALTFARSFSDTVLLVDCDFKNQCICRNFGIPGDAGLIDVILDDKPLQDVITWCGIDKLTLISGGQSTVDSTEILDSPKMVELVYEIKNRYNDRYVIFDLPPVLSRADAIAFAHNVDCILMVVEEGKTSLKEMHKALEVIPREKVLGFVVNKEE